MSVDGKVSLTCSMEHLFLLVLFFSLDLRIHGKHSRIGTRWEEFPSSFRAGHMLLCSRHLASSSHSSRKRASSQEGKGEGGQNRKTKGSQKRVPPPRMWDMTHKPSGILLPPSPLGKIVFMRSHTKDALAKGGRRSANLLPKKE